MLKCRISSAFSAGVTARAAAAAVSIKPAAGYQMPLSTPCPASHGIRTGSSSFTHVLSAPVVFHPKRGFTVCGAKSAADSDEGSGQQRFSFQT